MPTLQRSAGDRTHIEFSAEPSWQPERRKRGFFRTPPPPENRQEHASSLNRALQQTTKGITETAMRVGIDPSLLQVLHFDFIQNDAEQVLHTRYKASVVHEVKRKDAHLQEHYELTVQFPSVHQVERLTKEIHLYGNENAALGAQPAKERIKFFDSLVEVRPPSKDDRIGPRLRAEGTPKLAEFYLDIDLWHPGNDERAVQLLETLANICGLHAGIITERFRTESLLLAKVKATPDLLDVLTELPIIARLDLPPRVLAPYTTLLMRDGFDVPSLGAPEVDDPIVTVIDSGVLAGHPLLMNWVVEERDFTTSSSSPVDDHGHGTAVASLVVNGDVAECLQSGEWRPRVQVCSAKVLVKHDFADAAVFPEDLMIERVFEEAIRYFHKERGCRIFNISVESEPDLDHFGKQRQYPWAQLLDELARELDVVIVVLAGNNPSIPTPSGCATRAEFQAAVMRNMLCEQFRVSNPGTAALAVTVGSIARSDAIGPSSPGDNIPGLGDAVVGAKSGTPSPFSRTGTGYRSDGARGVVKPDVVQYGGNAALQKIAGGSPRWNTTHALLGEPVARFEFGEGRFVTALSGTSFASPHVAHAAALASVSLEESLGRPASANLIRAFVGSATEPLHDSTFQSLDEDSRHRLVGYGLCDLDLASWSKVNDVWLISEDTINDDRMVVYRIEVPPDFLSASGRRGITVSLAFDPPVRATRREYLSRTMWLEILQGLSKEEIAFYKGKYEGEGDDPSMPVWAQLNFKPAKTKVEWSTLQVRRKTWVRRPQIRLSLDDPTPAIHVLVGSKRRFETGQIGAQDFAIVVRMWHENDSVKLYQQLQSRVRTPAAKVRIGALSRR